MDLETSDTIIRAFVTLGVCAFAVLVAVACAAGCIALVRLLRSDT